jgi:hypothetical protein
MLIVIHVKLDTILTQQHQIFVYHVKPLLIIVKLVIILQTVRLVCWGLIWMPLLYVNFVPHIA